MSKTFFGALVSDHFRIATESQKTIERIADESIRGAILPQGAIQQMLADAITESMSPQIAIQQMLAEFVKPAMATHLSIKKLMAEWQRISAEQMSPTNVQNDTQDVAVTEKQWQDVDKQLQDASFWEMSLQGKCQFLLELFRSNKAVEKVALGILWLVIKDHAFIYLDMTKVAHHSTKALHHDGVLPMESRSSATSLRMVSSDTCLYRRPGRQGKIVMDLEAGLTVVQLNKVGKWSQVVWSNSDGEVHCGWVRSKYLKNP